MPRLTARGDVVGFEGIVGFVGIELMNLDSDDSLDIMRGKAAL